MMNSKRQKLLNGNLRKLLFTFSLPTVIGMIVASLYNLVDTIFVGKGVGPLAIAAITLILPIMMVFLAIATMIGMGAASIISRALGAGNRERAISAMAGAYTLGLLLITPLIILLYIFKDRILVLFGADQVVFQYASSYLAIVLPGFFFFTLSFIASQIIRAEGMERAATYPLIIGAVLNIILDWLFIFGMNMGVEGAALATTISQFTMFVVVILYFTFANTIFKLKKNKFHLKLALLKDNLRIGFPSFIEQISSSIIFILINSLILQYGNEIYLAIAGVGQRIILIALRPVFGIGFSFSTITSFNYGAERLRRVKKVLREAILWVVLLLCVVYIIIFTIPHLMLSVFSNDKTLILQGMMPLRIMALLLPFRGFFIIGRSFFQAIGKPRQALIINVSYIFILIPLFYILPLIMGINGVFASWPIAVFISACLSGIFLFREIKVLDHNIRQLGMGY
ncbi:MAG: MATE family efflux transporter [Actinobacteria bacterium]|nr:MATE family efflux transporter [Actinomycetota bacterium]